MKVIEKYKQEYSENGFLSPIRIISSAETKKHRQILEDTEKILGNLHYQSKMHTILKSAYDLATNKSILDIVENLIGKNILLYNSTYIIKEPQTPTFVSWHQDLTYWGFSHDDQVSVWLALSNADGESGAMYMIPGSHLEGKKEHKTGKEKNNVLSQSQKVTKFDESKKILCALKPGEASFHHGWTIHSSMPNNSNDRRIGLNIQYIATHLKQTKSENDSAICVRGTDEYNNFENDLPAQSDELDNQAVARRKEMHKKYKAIVSSKN